MKSQITSPNAGSASSRKDFSIARRLLLTLVVSLFAGSTAFAAVGTATRTLPATYTPGAGVNVQISTAPDAAGSAQGVEEIPPAGWVVTNISPADGTYANGKVSWIFFNATPQVLTYTATPPAGTTGMKTFTGDFSVDGASVTIGGNTTINQNAASISKSTTLALTVKILGKKKIKTTKSKLMIKGTATGSVTQIAYRIGKKGPYRKTAQGTTAWKFRAKLKPGQNLITVIARGPNGAVSAPAKVKVIKQ